MEMRPFRSPTALVVLLALAAACGACQPDTADTEAMSSSSGSAGQTTTGEASLEPTGVSTGPTTTGSSTMTGQPTTDELATGATTQPDPTTAGTDTTSTAEGGTTDGSSTGEPAECLVEIVHQGDLVVTDATEPEALRCIVDVTGRLTISDTKTLVSFSGLGSLRHVGDDVMIIDNAALVDLEGLRSLERIDGGGSYGELIIHGNPSLVDIAGLRALERLDSVSLRNNDALSVLTGLHGPIEGIAQPWWGLAITYHDSLVNLAGLEEFEGFSGYLIIAENSVLTDISALAPALAASSVELSITGNPVLLDMQGLEAITSAEIVTIHGNTALLDLSGLDGLQTVEPGHLVIGSNQQLIGVDGLDALVQTNQLRIEDNPALTNLDALANLDEVTKTLAIGECGAVGNDALDDLSGLAGLSVVGYLNIHGNDALASLAGLPGALEVAGLRIFSNSMLPTEAAQAYATQVGLADTAELCNNLGEPGICDCKDYMP